MARLLLICTYTALRIANHYIDRDRAQACVSFCFTLVADRYSGGAVGTGKPLKPHSLGLPITRQCSDRHPSVRMPVSARERPNQGYPDATEGTSSRPCTGTPKSGPSQRNRSYVTSAVPGDAQIRAIPTTVTRQCPDRHPSAGMPVSARERPNQGYSNATEGTLLRPCTGTPKSGHIPAQGM